MEKILCPIHNETTPSLVIDEDSQRYSCFGCNRKGTLLELKARIYKKREECVMAINKITSIER